jgi:hypothetical protein
MTMTTTCRGCRLPLLALLLAFVAWPALAAATLKQEVIGGVSVGAATTIQLTISNGKVSKPVQLPAVDGLTLNGSGTNPQPHSFALTFFVTPAHAGDITIPAFDIQTDAGETLHVNPIVLHVNP